MLFNRHPANEGKPDSVVQENDMKLHGKDKLMILDRTTHLARELPGAYRVIDNERYSDFIVKVFNSKTKKFGNRRFDKHIYAYSVEKDPEWKPSTIRRDHAGV